MSLLKGGSENSHCHCWKVAVKIVNILHRILHQCIIPNIHYSYCYSPCRWTALYKGIHLLPPSGMEALNDNSQWSSSGLVRLRVLVITGGSIESQMTTFTYYCHHFSVALVKIISKIHISNSEYIVQVHFRIRVYILLIWLNRMYWSGLTECSYM